MANGADMVKIMVKADLTHSPNSKAAQKVVATSLAQDKLLSTVTLAAQAILKPGMADNQAVTAVVMMAKPTVKTVKHQQVTRPTTYSSHARDLSGKG